MSVIESTSSAAYVGTDLSEEAMDEYFDRREDFKIEYQLIDKDFESDTVYTVEVEVEYGIEDWCHFDVIKFPLYHHSYQTLYKIKVRSARDEIGYTFANGYCYVLRYQNGTHRVLYNSYNHKKNDQDDNLRVVNWTDLMDRIASTEEEEGDSKTALDQYEIVGLVGDRFLIFTPDNVTSGQELSSDQLQLFNSLYQDEDVDEYSLVVL